MTSVDLSLDRRGGAAGLDLEFVRASFPGLSSDWILLDNAGGSQVLATVADRVRDYLLTTSVQTGATYEPSRRASERISAGAAAVAELFGADRDEIVLGGSSTQLLQNLARSLGADLGPGDEVIVSDGDHEANITPWLRLAERGVKVIWWETDAETLELEPARLSELLTERTRLVCLTQVSNLLGTIHPIAEIARRTHEAGARLVVDGVAFAPHRRVDVRAFGADFYVASLYKIFGPHCAALYVQRDALAAAANVNHEFVPREAIPYKLQPGGATYELGASLPAVVEYLDELGRRALGANETSTRAQRITAAFEAIARHEESVVAPLLEFLASRDDVRVLGCTTADRDRRVATVSFAVRDRLASEIPTALDAERIGIRYGDFHSRRLVQRLGLAERQGVVRISLAHYTTSEEIARTIAALESALG